MKRYMKNPCWKGYKPYGLKIKNGKKVPNCVPVTEELGRENEWGRPELTRKMLAITPGQEKAYIPAAKKHVKEEKITLTTNPNWYGADLGNYKPKGKPINIPLKKVSGFEPDEKMDSKKSQRNIQRIIKGIKSKSNIPPVLVRRHEGGYQVLDGHHRMWAHKKLGSKSITAHLVSKRDIVVKENTENDVETETTTYHTELNPKLWANKKLDSTVKDSLLKIANTFLKDLDVPLKIEDIILTGSNANYNWTKYSDLDLHIITDIKHIPDVALNHILKLIQAKRALWNIKHNITIKGYNVEVYVQQKNEILVATGVYSLMKDRWLAEPLMVAQSIDHPVIKAKAKHMMNEIDKAISMSDKEQIRAMIDKVAQLRKAGLQDKGEFSVENLVFKILRNSGHIEKLRKQLVYVIDKSLTVEEYLSEKVVETKPKNTPITAQTTSGTYQGVPYAVKRNSLIARALTSGLGSDNAAVTLPKVFGPGFNVYVKGNTNATQLRHEIQGHGQQINKMGDLKYLANYARGSIQTAARVLGKKVRDMFDRDKPKKPVPRYRNPVRTAAANVARTVNDIHANHPMEKDADTRELAQESKTPAWQRSEGKNPEGGLNRKGIASYRRQNPGSKLSLAVTTKPSKLKKGSKSWRRRKSFCARMSGMKRRLTSKKTASDPNSRINKALRKWNC